MNNKAFVLIGNACQFVFNFAMHEVNRIKFSSLEEQKFKKRKL